MANEHKARLIETLKTKFGDLAFLPNSQSLIDLCEGRARIYIRYSKVHEGGRTFFGLRDADLRALEGRLSFLCFLRDDDGPPLLINFADFEDVFRMSSPMPDGQHKVQLLTRNEVTTLYIAKRGHFNVEGNVGFAVLERHLSELETRKNNELSHWQAQTLLAGIGHLAGYRVWVPDSDVSRIDWSITRPFELAKNFPTKHESVWHIAREIDVVWFRPGSNEIEALFEVEHSTSIYSGLLRFNDLLLTFPKLNRFTIVANQNRRSLFARQVRRPTFVSSGLSDLATFMEYTNVLDWHSRVSQTKQ